MYTLPASAYSLLVPLYNSPNRHYHNLNHIQFCLSKLEEYLETKARVKEDFWDKELAKTHHILVLAIWFHDAICSPYPKKLLSNENESQSLFYEWFQENMLNKRTLGYESYNNDHDYLKTVYEYASDAILCTEHHLYDLGPNMLETTKLMLDIDLSGFAKNFTLVYNDSELIFKEYACLGLTHREMLENRVKFLQALLGKERIFYTDYFYNTYEAKARDNIEGVIELSLAELNK